MAGSSPLPSAPPTATPSPSAASDLVTPPSPSAPSGAPAGNGSTAPAIALEAEIPDLLAAIDMVPGEAAKEEVLRAAEEAFQRGPGEEAEWLIFDRLARWRWEPVSFETFVTSPLYLGLSVGERGDVWPGVMELCLEIVEGDYDEVAFGGAIGSAKTFPSRLLLLYALYEVSCLADPQRTLGLARDSSIAFVVQSVTNDKAKRVIFGPLLRMVRRSPYFSSVFPYDPAIKSELRFPMGVELRPVASVETGGIGEDVVAGILDETSFLPVVKGSKRALAMGAEVYDQAVANYNALAERRKSRFVQAGKKLPGWLIITSSPRFPDDFIAQKLKEAQHNPRIFPVARSTWDLKPSHRYSGKRFAVLVGRGAQRSRILEPGEEAADADVVMVPEEHRPEFERDLDRAIRDLVGRPTEAINRFIARRETIDAMFARAGERGQPFDRETSTLDDGALRVLRENLCLSERDADYPRAAHLDLAKNKDGRGDHAALAFGFVRGLVDVVRTPFEVDEARRLGELERDFGHRRDGALVERLPYIVVEGALRIGAKPGDEVQIEDVVALLLALKHDHGVPLRIVTADQWGSTQALQMLRRRGIAAEELSVDRTPEPYQDFRAVLYDGRIECPPHSVLGAELPALERLADGKIDHPHFGVDAAGRRAKGSKDVADAVAGVCHTLLTRRRTWDEGARPNPPRPR